MFIKQFQVRRYMNQASGEGEGGGGGGEAPKLTAEDIDRKIAGAVQGVWKRMESKLPTMIDEKLSTVVESFGGKFDELKALLDKPKPVASEGEGAGDKESPELLKLRKQIEMLTEQNRKNEQRAEEERKAREQREAEISASQEREALSKVLEEGGVKDARRAGAVAYLYLDQKRVKRNEKGEICFADKDSYGDEVLVPVAQGVKKWLSGDEGKAYLPPVETHGSGTRGGTGGQQQHGRGMNRAQAERELFAGGMEGIIAALEQGGGSGE